MTQIFDSKADQVFSGDCLREISPLEFNEDALGIKYFVFSKLMFKNPNYDIPLDPKELFNKYLTGGSREYPSDGSIPCDVAAKEAKKVLKILKELTGKNPEEYVRGTVKIYLGDYNPDAKRKWDSYATTDWRRKRFTDDIDFWVFDRGLLESVLKQTGWSKNRKTKEWEKTVSWDNQYTGSKDSGVLIAANDIEQAMDFTNCSYLDGTSLTNILTKKLKRGHDVDLNDIINMAMVNNNCLVRIITQIIGSEDWINSLTDYEKETNKRSIRWIDSWSAFERAANKRCTRTTSNMISLCRYSHGIADYIERVGKAIGQYKETVKDKSIFTDEDIVKICGCSKSWCNNHVDPASADQVRERIYNNAVKQERRKMQYAQNLRNFADKVIDLLNSKYAYANVTFEIEA